MIAASSYETLRRAAGAYGDLVLDRVGYLFLQSAVAAGLRIRDGNLYEPDPSLIPRDVRAVHRELRERWREQRALARTIGAWARDGGWPELRFTAETGELNGWSDPLPLARLAVALRPGDPLARITLFMTLLRYARIREAERHLAPVAAWECRMSLCVRTRWIWNKALLVHALGQAAAAAELMATCLRMGPGSRSHERDYLAYSVLTGQVAVGVAALMQLRDSYGLERARLALVDNWSREKAPVGRLLRREVHLARELSGVVNLGEDLLPSHSDAP